MPTGERPSAKCGYGCGLVVRISCKLRSVTTRCDVILRADSLSTGLLCMLCVLPRPALGCDTHPRVVASSMSGILHRDPHSGPGGATVAEEGSSAPASAGSGKLSRLRCVHPRRRISASYARAASSVMAQYPTT
jgi:hypothetical protein